MQRIVPAGMSRRHFMRHLAGASALTIPAITLTSSIRAQADELKRNRTSAAIPTSSAGPFAPTAPTGTRSCAFRLRASARCLGRWIASWRSGAPRRSTCAWNATAPTPAASPTFWRRTPGSVGCTIPACPPTPAMPSPASKCATSAPMWLQ